MYFHAQIGNDMEILHELHEIWEKVYEVMWKFECSEIARRAGQGGEMEESASHHL